MHLAALAAGPAHEAEVLVAQPPGVRVADLPDRLALGVGGAGQGYANGRPIRRDGQACEVAGRVGGNERCGHGGAPVGVNGVDGAGRRGHVLVGEHVGSALLHLEDHAGAGPGLLRGAGANLHRGGEE